MEIKNNKWNILKAVGIYLVIAAHCDGVIIGLFPLFSFLMPLFFFISGYFFRDMDFLQFLRKKVMRLLLPLYVWHWVYLAFAMFLGNYGFNLTDGKLSFVKLFVVPLVGYGGMVFCEAGWFLGTLFVAFLLYFAINRVFTDDKVKTVVCILLPCVGLYMAFHGYCDYLFHMGRLLSRSLFVLFFINLGQMYKKYEQYDRLSLKGTFIACLINVFMMMIYGDIGLNIKDKIFNIHHMLPYYGQGSYLLPFVVACTGIYLSLQFAKLVQEKWQNSSVINFVSKNTLSIMLHHVFVLFLIKWILYILQNKGYIVMENWDTAAFLSDCWYIPNVYPYLCYIYLFLGLAVPCAGCWLWDKMVLNWYKSDS